MTIIKVTYLEEPFAVTESYQTIKNRALRSELFVEVTMDNKKVMINKMTIEEFGPYLPEQDPLKIKEKAGAKKKKKS
jgi:hypothetical protein